MDELTKIAYNCEKATFLIEKQLIGTITMRQKMELKIHLAGCKICRTFEQQSKNINRMVHDLFHGTTHQEQKLDDDFKKSLQERIEKEYTKNN